MEATAEATAALAAHWSQLGNVAGGTRHDREGLIWFETPVRRLPFNGVVSTRLGEDADVVIERIASHLRSRGVDFWWVQHPGSEPADLGDRLQAAGLQAVERMNFMYLDLRGWEAPLAPPDVTIVPAVSPEQVAAYTELTLRYWEIEPGSDDAAEVARIHSGFVGESPGQRFLAVADGRAIGKGYLSWPAPPGVAAVYGMSVVPEARGRGVAKALTVAMVHFARERGFRRVVLHATDMAVGVYARAGFARCGTAAVFATAPVWNDP